MKKVTTTIYISEDVLKRMDSDRQELQPELNRSQYIEYLQVLQEKRKK